MLAFAAKIFSVVNRTVRLELFDNVHRAESFNDMLINIGYADKWEESPQSRLNHEARRRMLPTRDESGGRLKLELVDQTGVYNPDEVIEVSIALYLAPCSSKLFVPNARSKWNSTPTRSH